MGDAAAANEIICSRAVRASRGRAGLAKAAATSDLEENSEKAHMQLLSVRDIKTIFLEPPLSSGGELASK